MVRGASRMFCSTGFPLSRASSWSSSERAPAAPVEAADVVRDAPLYPVLRDDATDATDTSTPCIDTEHTGGARSKRASAQDWERAPKVSTHSSCSTVPGLLHWST